MTDLERDIAFKQRAIDGLADEHQDLALQLRELDIWLSQKNVIGEHGLRISVVAHEAQRLVKVREKFAIEKRVALLNKEKRVLSDEVFRLKTELKKVTTAQEEFSLKEKLNLAQAMIDGQRKTLLEWESKYRTLDRQFDLVVRELNALKGERVAS